MNIDDSECLNKSSMRRSNIRKSRSKSNELKKKKDLYHPVTEEVDH